MTDYDLRERINQRDTELQARISEAEARFEARLGEAVKQAAAGAWRRGLQEGLDFVDHGDDETGIAAADGGLISLGYRSRESMPRDLSAISQERAIAAAYRLWNTNPLGKAITEILVDYVIGDGITLSYESDEVQAALEPFWRDPVNDLQGGGTESMVRELGLFGEQLILAFVRTGEDSGGVADGLLRLGAVDPAQIGSIVTHKQNKRDILAVRIKSESGDALRGPLYKLIKAETAGQAMQGLRDLEAYARMVKDRAETEDGGHAARLAEAQAGPDGKAPYPAHWRRLKEGAEWNLVEQPAPADEKPRRKGNRTRPAELKKLADAEELTFDGECFLFQINKMSTGVRGRPDMLPLIDWLDRFDQLFFDGAEHVGLLNSVVWDLEVEGGRALSDDLETNLRYQANIVRGMPPGSVYAHNEKTTLEAKVPDLKTPQLETLLRQLRVFIAGGARIPEHWLAEGGYTNRATAAEMGEPTFRMLIRRQEFVRQMLLTICQYQVDVMVALGLLPEEVPTTAETGEESQTIPAREAFDVVMSEIDVADTTALAGALMQTATAVFRLYASKMLPLKPAIELVAAIAGAMGVEIDVDAVLKAMELEDQGTSALADLLKQAQDEDERAAAEKAAAGTGQDQPAEEPMDIMAEPA
jgi:hypothetical protein